MFKYTGKVSKYIWPYLYVCQVNWWFNVGCRHMCLFLSVSPSTSATKHKIVFAASVVQHLLFSKKQ